MDCGMTFWDFAHAHATGLGTLIGVLGGALILAWVLVCFMRAVSQ